MTSCDVLVVGGGPAGLTAASELARGGRRVVLVDSGEDLGGMAASKTVDGLRVDLGSHRLHPVAAPRVERLLRDLLGADLQTRPRHGRLRLADQWVRFPLRPGDLARRLPVRFAGRAMVDTVSGPVRRRRSGSGEDTFATVVSDGLGPAMLDWFYGPYAQKLWGRPADELAGELARRRIAANSPNRIVAKLARAARGERPSFRYPRLGYGQVVERLVERGVAAGLDVRPGTVIERLDIGVDRVVASGAVDAIEAQRVMWTAPPDVLAAVAQGVDGPDRPAAVRHRAMVCVYLTYDVPSVSEYDAHYLPGADDLATRVSEPKNYRNGPDPDDRTVLCAEVPCDVGDDVWTSSPDALADRLAGDLARLGLIDRAPTGLHVERLPRVYPCVTPSDVEPLRRLHAWAADVPHVTVLGRQGLVVADNLHHVMAMALDAVDCLGADGSWNRARWAAALHRFGHHVVED